MSEKDLALPAYGWCPRKDQMEVWRAITDPSFQRGTIVASRRWGKDETALQALVIHAMRRVGSYWYCLPEYEQARKAVWTMVNWRTKRTRIDDAIPMEIREKTDNDSMWIKLISGSTIQLIGSDRVDSLVGGGQIGIVMSEAALSNPKAKMLFMPILEESGGWILELSTPRGKGPFYKSYLANKEDMAAGVPGRFAALLPADKTGLFPPEQLERIKRDLIREHGTVIGMSIFNQEYLCSFDAAVVGAVWGAELEEMEMQDRVRPCPYDKRFPCFTSWDLGIADQTWAIIWQYVNGEYRLIDALMGTGMGLDSYIATLKDWHHTKGYNYAKHFGPHDIQNRDFARGLSRIDEAKRMGLTFTRTPQTRLRTQIIAGAHLIRQMVVNSNNDMAMQALEHFKQWKYPVNKSTGQFIETPEHSIHSHASSALCTYAINVAKDLGVSGFVDPELHADLNGALGGTKFDPRMYGNAPFSHANSVSSMMRGRRPGAGTAFG